MKKYVKKIAAGLAAAVCALSFAGCGAVGIIGKHDLTAEITVNTAEYVMTEAERTVTGVVEKAADSVVEIVTETVTGGSFLSQYVTEGAGSGVILSKEGYIVTNDHVAGDADTITVTLRSGEKFSAELVGTDAKTDIAVIRIDPQETELVPATIGVSSALKVGQSVVAIGNPLGSLGGTVTEGILSALDREITVGGMRMRLLQTSAAINPGNSGGGLFNMNGDLIAIVNAKSTGEDIEGLGFAIPIDGAREIFTTLIEKGYVPGRPALGVTLSFQSYRYNGTTVTLPRVESVTNSQSGLRVGDVILSVGGTTCSSAEALVGKLYSDYEAGGTAVLEVSRNNGSVTVNAVLVDAHG